MKSDSRNMDRRTFVAAGISAGALAMPLISSASAATPLRLLTAPPGDAYFPIGVALATLVKIKLLDAFGIDMVAENSPGAQANPALLQKGEGEFAFTQHFTLASAGFAGREGLQTVATLWPTVDHVLVNSQSMETGNLQDITRLVGQAAYFGNAGSSAFQTNTALLEALSLNPMQDFGVFSGSYEDAVAALLRGQIALASLPGAVPIKAVKTAFREGKGRLSLLSINRSEQQRIDDDRGIWAPTQLSAGTYKGQTASVSSLQQPNILVVREDVPRKTVYRMLDAIFSDVAFLHQIHPATKQITIESAASPTLLAFHPGAEEFYLDNGIDVTDV